MIAEGTIHKGAGILFITPEGKALFLKRGDGGDAPGMWCFPGGTVEAGETTEQTAVREAEEELGSYPAGKLMMTCRTIMPVVTAAPTPVNDRVDFTTYVQKVAAEFTPKLNGEHVGWAWAPISQAPEPLHPGCVVALAKLGWNELDIAKAMAEGVLTSPQLYGNVHLFDMRITGTGVSYRGAKKDDKGKVTQDDEFVYRRPENYLTPEFVQRCNGLSVIWKHPKKSLLTSDEYADRVVGSMMLPYIKGDEVWGIAKVYDDEVIGLLKSNQLSTSPAISLAGVTNQMMKTENGTNLLIEGKPSLLDHLAICERGVWDKGGEPSGVRTDNQGDINMALSIDDKNEVQTLITAGLAAGLKAALLDTTVLSAIRADDAGGSEKIGKVMDTINAFCGKLDAFEKKMDTFEKKMDEDKDAPKKVAADKKDSKKDGDDDMMDADEKAAKEKADADEKEAKEKADAEAKEKADAEEKEKSEKADAALRIENADIRAQLAALQKAMPKALTDADRHAFSSAQARADEVYTAFGNKAPFPLSGEAVVDYRKRLITPFKEHSAAWSKVDLIKLDAEAFDVAEGMIFKDAEIASRRPADLKPGELRGIVRTDSTTGQRTTEFVGANSFIASMGRQPRHVRRIGVQPTA